MSRPAQKPAHFVDPTPTRTAEGRPREQTGEHPVVSAPPVSSSPDLMSSEDATEITTQWVNDGWLVISRWHRASLGTVLARCGDMTGDHTYRVREEDDTWSFMNDRERVTVTASDDGRTFTEHWEVRGDDGAWYPLCDVSGTRIETPEIDA